MKILEMPERANSKRTGNPQLADLAQKINEYHQRCQDAVNDAVHFAAQAGQVLLEVKESLNHGEWLPWLQNNCACSPRQAQRYIRIATKLPELRNATRASYSSQRQALQLIADGMSDRESDATSEPSKPIDVSAPTDTTKPSTDERVPSDTVEGHAVNLDSSLQASSDECPARQEASTSAPVVLRMHDADRRTRSSAGKVRLEQFLSFAAETPEAKALDMLVREVQAAAKKHASSVMTETMRISKIDERDVQNALLTKLAKRLEDSASS